MTDHDAKEIRDDTYRMIFAMSPDSIVITDSRGKIIEANDSFSHLFQTGRHVLKGINIRSFVEGENRKLLDTLIERLLAGETVTGFELKAENVPGGPFVYEINAIPCKKEKTPERLIFIAHDITSKTQIHSVWRTLSSIVESTDDAITGKTLDGTVVSWNKGAERIYGYTEAEMIGHSIDVILPADRKNEFKKISKKLHRGERLEHLETVRLTKDGRKIDVSLTISPILDKNGNIAGASTIARDITAQKKMLKELQDSETRYRGLVESQYDLIVRVSPDGSFTFVNDVYCEKFGKKRDDIIGKSFVPLVHEDDIGPTLEAMKKLDVPPYRIYVEQRAMTVDGWRWLAWEDYAIKDEHGVTIEIQAVGRDITERKNVEIALRENQQKYQSVFDKANDYIVLIDSHGTLLEINERIKSGMGYSDEELVGKNLSEVPFLSEPEKIKAKSRLKKRLRGEPVGTYELAFIKKNGEALIGEVNATLIKSANGDIFDLIVIRDITERKKAEEDRIRLITKLNDKTTELNTILGSVGDAIVTMNTDHIITMANKAFIDMIGLQEYDILGHSCDSIIGCIDEHESSVCEDGCKLGETLSTLKTTTNRSIIRSKDGKTLTISSINSPLISADGTVTGVVKSIRDISKEAEVERMKNEFVSTVSHELRTPLTSIKGFVDVILEGDAGEITDLQKEFLDIIAQNTDRLASLINDLLDIEKIEAGKITLKKQRISLYKLVMLAAKSMEQTAADKNLQFKVNAEKEIEIEADPDKIMQILLNLLSNAIKFTSKGSVEINLRRVDRHSVLSVKDTGIGINKADINNLFNKFFRAEDAQSRNIGGTGLGLSIVKALVEMHNGTVTVHSIPGSGSEFTVILPALKKSRKKQNE